MEAIQIYAACASGVFGLLGMAWRRDDWLNTFVKISLICMSFIGIFLTFQAAGYIVKI